MFVTWCLLVLLNAGLVAANPVAPIFNFSKLNCSSLCGLPFAHARINEGYGGSSVSRAKNMSVNLDGQCVNQSQLSIGNWEESARRFLQLINMSDVSFDCPKWNSVYRQPNETELPKLWNEGYFQAMPDEGMRRLPRPYFKTSVVDPAGIPGHCNITIDRGVVERNLRVYLMDAELQYEGNPLMTTGSIISLWRKRKYRHGFGMRPFWVHLPRNHSNECQGNNCSRAPYETMWLPASTFGTAVPYKGNSTQHYSMFAKWDFEQIPGINKMMVKLRTSVSHLENVGDDLSPSNIAILSLPLLMAIPPISLLEHVSSVATAWYVFATDILAALPLLIKGIELVIVYPKTKVHMYSTLSMTGKKYGVYERWFTQCYPPVGMTQTAGTIIISVALWFMMASSYCEFAFWRAVQYRLGRWNNIDVVGSNVIDEEREEVNESNPSDSKQTSSSWHARHRIHILGIVFLILLALFISSIAARLINIRSNSRFFLQFNGSLFFIASGTVKWGTIIALITFHMIATNRVSHLRFLWFLAGIVFGIVGGPLYLLLHLMKSVRESKNWDDVSCGANVGMAFLGTCLALFFGSFLPFHVAFVWLYGGAIIALHAIRSLPRDRVRWRYGLNGFAAGMLFGPFGIYFRRCFPETMNDKQARANFHGGSGFGVIFLLTVVNMMTTYWAYIVS